MRDRTRYNALLSAVGVYIPNMFFYSGNLLNHSFHLMQFNNSIPTINRPSPVVCVLTYYKFNPQRLNSMYLNANSNLSTPYSNDTHIVCPFASVYLYRGASQRFFARVSGTISNDINFIVLPCPLIGDTDKILSLVGSGVGVRQSMCGQPDTIIAPGVLVC